MSRISIINYAIGLLVLFFIISIQLYFSRKPQTIYVDITPPIQLWNQEPYPPPFTVADSIKVGDSSYNWIGQKSIEVTNIDKVDWGGRRSTITITAKVRVVYDPRTHQYLYGNVPMLVGGDFYLNTQNTMFVGQIINVYRTPSDRYRGFTKKEADVTLNWRKLDPSQADSLQSIEATNSEGQVLAQIKNIRIVPAEVDVNTDRGIIYKGYSTIYKDVVATIHLRNVYCSGASCYFEGQIPLKIGSEFNIWSTSAYYDNVAHMGIITDISYDQK